MKAGARSAAPARRGFEPNWPARLGWALLLLYVVYAGSRLGFNWERFADGLEHGGAVPRPHVPAQFRALAAPLRRHRREPADCRDRDLFRHSPVAPGRPSRVAQPDAALDHLAGPRLHRTLSLVPSDHRRDPI